jgi:hypothetical protein
MTKICSNQGAYSYILKVDQTREKEGSYVIMWEEGVDYIVDVE